MANPIRSLSLFTLKTYSLCVSYDEESGQCRSLFTLETCGQFVSDCDESTPCWSLLVLKTCSESVSELDNCFDADLSSRSKPAASVYPDLDDPASILISIHARNLQLVHI